ncbi:MAG: glycosyltransferase family 2 protein [Dictyoglomus sp.]|nr:glycosyltransferase family 2 protein [Dictyoglomus sp.]MCX7942496.1 glycosyltransferase family 2 protein [Dictyoglomaceae bacterium]MDW8188912.1 glycosyltransferase family 2 protein [Dictyoglomus sp.]
MRIILFFLSWLIGWIYYKRLKLLERKGSSEEYKISVIIPARDEEKNLPKLLSSLKNQTYKPYEIILVNDNSRDRTEEIGREHEVKVVSLKEEPPEGWIGKNWALWNGYIESKGELLLFLDADVEPREDFIEVLLSNYDVFRGLISCWPYQRFEKFYEHFNFTFNLVSIFSMFASDKKEGAFGPAIIISREDYERIGGHKKIRSKILEDLALAKECINFNIPVNNFLGGKYIKFRMYNSFKDLFLGFTKNIAKGAFSINIINFLLIFFYFYGIYGSIFYFKSDLLNPFYLIFVIQFYIVTKKLGDYKFYDAIIYPLHFLFFLFTFLYSLFRTFFVKTVIWKGRKIHVD